MAYVIYEYDWRNEYVKPCFYNGFYTFQGMKYAILVDIEEAKIYRKSEKQMMDICKKLDRKFENISGYFRYFEIQDLKD